MLEKHQLKILSDAVSEAWKNINFTKVNGLDVRLRVIKDRAANFTHTPTVTSCSAAWKASPISIRPMTGR